MADKGLTSSKKQHFNDQHKMLHAYIHALLCKESATVVIAQPEAQPAIAMTPAPEFHTPEDVSRLVVESQAETTCKLFLILQHRSL